MSNKNKKTNKNKNKKYLAADELPRVGVPELRLEAARRVAVVRKVHHIDTACDIASAVRRVTHVALVHRVLRRGHKSKMDGRGRESQISVRRIRTKCNGTTSRYETCRE